MFPTDEEFLILYSFYIGLFFILFAGIKFSKNKIFFKKNLMFFISYTLLMTFIFINAENFKGGSSLLVLFVGGLFIILHLLILVLKQLYIFFKQRNIRIRPTKE